MESCVLWFLCRLFGFVVGKQQLCWRSILGASRVGRVVFHNRIGGVEQRMA